MEDMLKTLTRRSFAAGRARNGIAVLAIALTAVLFTAIAAIQSFFAGMILETINQKNRQDFERELIRVQRQYKELVDRAEDRQRNP